MVQTLPLMLAVKSAASLPPKVQVYVPLVSESTIVNVWNVVDAASACE